MSLDNSVFAGVLKLANAGQKDDLSAFDGLGDNSDLAAALAEMAAEEKKEAVKQSAKALLALFKQGQAEIESKVTQIRNLRRTEKDLKQQIDTINRARAYGSETGNYIPLTVLLGGDAARRNFTAACDDFQALSVPDSWQPKVTEEKPAAKPAARSVKK